MPELDSFLVVRRNHSTTLSQGIGGFPMQDQTILKRGSIEITTKIARFAGTTFQVSNVGSVATFVDRKFNIIAIALFVVSIVAGFVFFDMNSKQYGNSQVPLAITATCLIGGILLQMFWPRRLFTFVLKTSSNDVHRIVSEDGEFLEAIHGAIETAFVNN